MLDLRIKEAGIYFSVAEGWGELTFGTWLDILDADNDEAEILSALSGVDIETLLDSNAPELSELVHKKLKFLNSYPKGFEESPKPKTVAIGDKLCKVPEALGAVLNWRERLDLDEYIKRAGQKDATVEATGLMILSVVFFEQLTGRHYKDMSEVDEVKDLIRGLPALPAVKLSTFFLANSLSSVTSGKLEYAKPPEKTGRNVLHKWPLRKFRSFVPFTTFTTQKERLKHYASRFLKYMTFLGIALLTH